MMLTALASTALLMGLAGGPHCIAMCGAACAGISGSAGQRHETRGMLLFQIGRLIGYSAMGALAAASMQALGWLTVQTAAIRPVWTLFHVACALIGLTLVWQARQPLWFEQAGRAVWRRVRAATNGLGRAAPLWIGAAWAFMPCGLLYSALLVAAVTGDAARGALVMALFAAGSSVSLWLAPWLLQKLRSRAGDELGMRLAGFALLATSVAALWIGLMHDAAPWCVSPR
ncbi:MAG: sulfite exporter TauE/SafE family protein [Burkholderiales bacterium]